MTRKIVNNADAGDATHHGGNDFDYVNQYLTGQDQSGADPVTIATNTVFKDQKLRLQNPDNTFAGIINMSAITADRNITLPLESANMNLVSRNSTDILTNKTIEAKSQTKLPGMLTDPLVKRHGLYMSTSGAPSLVGMFSIASTIGTLSTSASMDTTYGYYRDHASAASAGSAAGFLINTGVTPETMRKWNPRLRFIFATPATTTQRMMAGFSSTNIPATDTLLANTDSGVLFGYKLADANFSVYNNDGSAAMVTNASATAKDTAIHTVEIILDDSVPNCIVTLDGTTIATITTRLPASTTPLGMYIVAETTTTTARNMRLYRAYFEDTPQ